MALSGAMIREQIVQTLKYQKLEGSPAIDPVRKFPNCDNQLSVKSIFGSWKTVRISCPGTDWQIAVSDPIGSSGVKPRKNRNCRDPLRPASRIPTAADGPPEREGLCRPTAPAGAHRRC